MIHSLHTTTFNLIEIINKVPYKNNMEIKKKLFILGLLLFSPFIRSQVASFYVNGKVDSKYNDKVVTLSTFIGDSIRSIDSTYVTNGHFYFKGSEYLYEQSQISMQYAPDSTFTLKFFLERGPIEVELKQEPVLHSPFATDYQQYRDSCRSIPKTFSIEGQSEAFYKAGWERFFAYKYQFKKKYIHNGIGRSLFLADAQYRDDPYFYKLYELLPDSEKKRNDVIEAYQYRKDRDAQDSLVNKTFLDFPLKNAADEEKRISDYVGKSRLLYLDFWASWCGPCIAQEPHIKELYEKYKSDGLEILGISLDVSKERWMNAIENKGISWPELYVGNQERVEEIRKLYCIIGIPVGFLIDKTGKIVSVITAQWQHLQWVLEEYYKK
nr:TlpA disulfide reductase family protein [uncultured Bacteroides sp.]